MIQFETKLLRVEVNEPTYILDLLTDAPKTQNEALGRFWS